jgi:cytoskeletal protein CcmA (bactofilin family)
LLVLAGLVLLLVVSSPVQAAEVLSGPTVSVAEGEVINDDVYATGGSVVVKGTINGDLVAAGGNVSVEGTVTGDVIAAGGNVNITGTVGDDIRAAGGNVNVISTVGGDVVVAGGSIYVEGTVRGDLLVGSGSLELKGVIEGDVSMSVGEAIINGVIKGNVQGEVGDRLTLSPGARIEGNLSYKSREEVKLGSGAQVLGQTHRTIPGASILGWQVQDSPWVRLANKVISQVRWFIGITLVGLALLWLAPRVYRETMATLIKSPWKSLGSSLLVLALAPLVLLVLAAVSFVLGGWAAVAVPLVPVSGFIALLSLAAPILAMLVGTLALGKFKGGGDKFGWRALLVGAAVLAIAGLIPVVGAIAGVLTVLAGFGAWALFVFRGYMVARREQRA